MAVMVFDLPTILLATAGIGLAVSFSVVAGIVSANVFFNASREIEEKRP